MSKLPEGWKEEQLKNIVDKDRKITYGIVQPGGDISPNGIPLIRGKDYSSGQINLTGLYHVSEAIDKPYKRSKVKENDILLTIVGYVGQTAIVPKELENANITQTTARISVNPTIADYKYIDYFLNSFLGQKNLKKYEKGSAQAGLNLKDIEKVKIYLAPLEEQKKIAEILSTVDQKIAFVDNQIEETELLKKGLMQKLLTEGIGHTEFKDSELGRIPVEWEVVKLKNLSEKISDGIHTTPKYTNESKYYFINGNNLNDGKIEYGEKTKQVSYEEYIKHKKDLNENTVLLSINGTIGNTAFYNNEHIVLGKSAAYIICNDLINKYFLRYLLSSAYIKKYFELELTGTTIRNLSIKTIKNTKIGLPPLQEQKQIAEILSTADEKLENLKAKKESFEELKKGLMQKLLTGEVRV